MHAQRAGSGTPQSDHMGASNSALRSADGMDGSTGLVAVMDAIQHGVGGMGVMGCMVLEMTRLVGIGALPLVLASWLRSCFADGWLFAPSLPGSCGRDQREKTTPGRLDVLAVR